jgi:hypothetical protein
MYGTSPIEVLAREAMRARLVFLEAFDYVARFLVNTGTALGANNSQTVPIQIDAGWDFVIQEYLGIWINADGTTFNAAPNALVEFTRDTAGKNQQSLPVHWLNVFGSYSANKVPNQLPFPVLLSEKSTYNIKLTNLTADAPDQVETTYRGFKVYYRADEKGRTITRDELFGRQF